MSEYADKIKQKVIDKDIQMSEQRQPEDEPELDPMSMLSGLMSPDEEKGGQDEVIKLLFEHPDIRKITDITPNELVDLTVLKTFAKNMEVPLIDYFVETRLTLALSKNRKSREEVVEIYKTQTYGDMGMMGEEGQPSRFQRMKDRFMG